MRSSTAQGQSPVERAMTEPLVLAAGAAPIAGYTLVRLLGRGGFGEVWEARAPGDFRVALKFIRLDTTEASVEQWSLDVIRHIRHPHLLDVQFATRVADCLVIAMPLCDESLMDRLRASPHGLPRDRLLVYMDELARAVDFLNEPKHRSSDGQMVGVQHRDIKPHNIFLVGGSVRLADFGLAKILAATSASHTGSMSLHYVAPEVVEGRVSKHSDQYSLAVTYVQLRTGKLPFEGDSALQILYAHIHREPDLSALPEQERPVVARALARQPEQRWPTCRDFTRALAAASSASRDDDSPIAFELDDSTSTPIIAPTKTETRPVIQQAPDYSRLRVSTYYPKEVLVQLWHPFFAYIFRESAARAVEADARARLGKTFDACRQRDVPTDHPLAPGALVTVTPKLEGFQFNPPSLTIELREEWHRFEFRIRAGPEMAGRASNGMLTFTVESVIIADIAISIYVGDRESVNDVAVASGRPYQAIFCSYSHQDRRIVERVESACKTLGVSQLRDVITLRSGQCWRDELSAMIERADIFQLFWSHSAARSVYVEQEWRYALGLGRQTTAFIRPVYWEEPIHPPPSELELLHFAFVPELSPWFRRCISRARRLMGRRVRRTGQ
jgi:serine/threonine protein kinase